jgi:thymidylate synthase (FAD)
MLNSEFDPLKDGKSRIELVGHMGTDLDVVNDARTSFEKASTELTNIITPVNFGE